MDRNGSGNAGSRSPRIFTDDEGWFFRTREGQLAGPFRDELEASTQLEVYIRMIKTGMLPANDN